MSEKICILFILTLLLIYLPQPVYSAADLIKAPNSTTVYYVDENNIRHVFPNQITYQSWFGNDFNQVMTMSEEYIASLPLGKNITLKPGKYLAKVPSAPEVYAVEPGGTLRHIKTTEVAEKIYSSQWQKKLVDLPEVFFKNYVVGEPIEYEYQIPDGVVYKITGPAPFDHLSQSDKNNNSDQKVRGDYYYKTAGHVRKFAGWQDVLDNGYNQDDVVEHLTTFLLHAKEIKGYDASINNLVAENNLVKYDCENKNLKGAVIFIYENNYTTEQLNKIKSIKSELPEYYNWATDGLSGIDLSDEIFLIKKEDHYIFKGNLSLQQIGYDFYDQHQDIYDFLFIFDNFSPTSKIIAEHNLVTNQINGIQQPILRAEVQYGSLGKLKGVINMFNVNQHSFTIKDEQINVLNRLVHEILHQWSGKLVFLNDNFEADTSLFDKETSHWSNYVNFTSPLGGLGWQENNDGSFSYPVPETKTKLSNLDLYAMGLLPIRGIGEIFYIIPNAGEYGYTVEGKKVEVDAESFETAMGKWQCVN